MYCTRGAKRLQSLESEFAPSCCLRTTRHEGHFEVISRGYAVNSSHWVFGYPLGAMNASDRLLSSLDHALRTVAGASHASRACPKPPVPESAELSAEERRLSGALMRVNHVGEVCAQALYQAQALTARSDTMRQQMLQASREEADHLAWTKQRLDQLGDRMSMLNPLWYAGAFGIGLLAGKLGDAVSLGFVVETERQVEQHLAGHLDRLPAADQASRAIVEQMKVDEAQHADAAEAAGANLLPAPARWLMKAAARVMTTTAHYV
jgi:3-demethoxyubiquinol 3-hydroxylase